MKFSNDNKHLLKHGEIGMRMKNEFHLCDFRPMVTSNYIPRFSEGDYVANGWIKSDPDVILLPQPNIELDMSPKPHDRSWTTNSTRIQTT